MAKMYRVDTWVGGLLIESHYSEKKERAEQMYEDWTEYRARYDGIEITLTECDPVYKSGKIEWEVAPTFEWKMPR